MAINSIYITPEIRATIRYLIKDKKREQIINYTYEIDGEQYKKCGFREILLDGLYKEFYRGFHYALMRAIPLHATAFMTMEMCKKYC
jgi:hypothetical protein